MTRFLLFISSILLAIFTLFSGREIFFGAEKTSIAVQDVVQNTSSTSRREAVSREISTTTPPKKIVPAASLPLKNVAPIFPKTITPKVAVPLVHYTEGKRVPNTLLSSEVVAWTNTYREQNNLKALQRNSKLDAAAIIKVHDMFDRQYFEHVSPSGKNSADLVSGVGYEYLWVGENLALGIFSDEKDLVDAWMASPGHRANILNSHFEEIGVGVEEGMYEGNHVWLAVQEFGKPASSCPAPEASIKTEIEQNRKKIDNMSAQASASISEINMLKNENDAPAYNQKVSEYNALIAELNPLVQETKSLVDIYNKEINEYNACIGTT
jgi:uncharacterized protein YkwD